MRKIVFILVMLFSPNLNAATLTPNTIPYVCQGGSTPQLCSSNMTTDNNGKVTSGGLGAWVTVNKGTPYQAATDGFVLLTCTGTYNSNPGSYTLAQIFTDGNNPPTTLRSDNDVNMGEYKGYEVMTAFSPVRKNDYYEGFCGGDQPVQTSTMYFISIGT